MSLTDLILNELTDESIAVLCLPNVHWSDGALIDLEKIREYIDNLQRLTKPLLVIDGTQSIGALRFDVRKIRPALVACSVHKWLNSPYGMSLVYLDPSFHGSWQPLDHHERNRLGNESWDEAGAMNSLTGYPTEFKAGACRLDSGGRPNPTLIPMIRNSLQVLCKWNPCNIQDYLAQLTDHLVNKVSTNHILDRVFHFRKKSNRCGHIIGLHLKPYFFTKEFQYDVSISNGEKKTVTLTCSAIGQKLKRLGVHLSVRNNCLRVAPYLYHNFSHIDRFVAILTDVVLSTVNEPLTDDCSLKYTNSLPPNPSKYRVLMSGSAGWLGQFLWKNLTSIDDDDSSEDLKSNLSNKLHVEALYHQSIPTWIPYNRRHQVDIRDQVKLRQLINNFKPHYFIHLSALSSPLSCHKSPDIAMEINCPIHLTEIIREIVPDCVFIYTSTDLVYDGEHAPYDNMRSPPQPSTVYGATKLAFEEHVLSLKHGLVLRLSNMIGAPYVYSFVGKKFLQFLYETFVSKQSISLRWDEKRSFVYVNDVVLVIRRLIELTHESLLSKSDDFGIMESYSNRIFNVGGPQGLSRLELAALVASYYNTRLVVSNAEVLAARSDILKMFVEADGQSNLASFDFSDEWIVSACRNEESVVSSGIANPRDVTMTSSETEAVLRVRFQLMTAALKLVFKSIGSY
jgi:dTDP-4-dehydrorhamnose reductase/kynureninase